MAMWRTFILVSFSQRLLEPPPALFNGGIRSLSTSKAALISPIRCRSLALAVRRRYLDSRGPTRCERRGNFSPRPKASAVDFVFFILPTFRADAALVGREQLLTSPSPRSDFR